MKVKRDTLNFTNFCSKKKKKKNKLSTTWLQTLFYFLLKNFKSFALFFLFVLFLYKPLFKYSYQHYQVCKIFAKYSKMLVHKNKMIKDSLKNFGCIYFLFFFWNNKSFLYIVGDNNKSYKILQDIKKYINYGKTIH